MKTLLLTNEYPPNIYGGAGVHVDYLSRELAKLMEVEVRCFGDQRNHVGNLEVRGFGIGLPEMTCAKALQSPLGAARRCVDFNGAGITADLVHCHTWYTHLGGIMAKLNYGIPLVITVHSLEPLRPWKREQLGGGYDFSLWVEKTALEMADAVIAVSEETRSDLRSLFNIPEERMTVIHNGIDLSEYTATKNPETLRALGVDPTRPYVLFVGRITRQKGIIHLVRAIRHMNPDFQIVLCAGAPDTPEIALEMQAAIAEARGIREEIVWIEKMVSRPEAIALYSGAEVFVCPSIYEPFGIINLEAMACGTPVVASAVGGIKEVVVNGETGFLVPLKQMTESPFEATDPEAFANDLATKVNLLMADPVLASKMGAAGRKRAEELFSWDAIARKTERLYAKLLQR
ncbi:MAG: glycogen synthase [Verrucomicrobia bacterium]|nr:MAG: glycogen synthase [Verrucomicrobiota bacterium]